MHRPGEQPGKEPQQLQDRCGTGRSALLPSTVPACPQTAALGVQLCQEKGKWEVLLGREEVLLQMFGLLQGFA